MDFISNQEDQLQEMLQTIGLNTFEDLLPAIPKELLLPRPAIDDGLSEYEGLKLMEKLGKSNGFAEFENYLGGGAYEHHIPAIVAEFLTAYTPYQAEVSQGMLQSIFEFQSTICTLTGMDVSNGSVYDGASACAEAILMALRIQKERKKILIAETLNPHYRHVVEQYLTNHDVAIETLPMSTEGEIDLNQACSMISEDVGGILIQSPNFLGSIEHTAHLFSAAKEKGAIAILCANPLAYGLYQTAKEVGADIAVGDTQPFGLPLNYGGPYCGYLACKIEFLRQLPGRVLGETVDTEGREGFVLTLQAREQHIRREKATSNICTNQALAALSSLVAMLYYGKEGIPKLALTNYQRASYLKQGLLTIEGVRELNQVPFLNEFALFFPKPVHSLLEHFRSHGIEPGIPLGTYFPELEGYLLITVTETKNKEQLDRYIEVAKQLCGEDGKK